MQLFKKPEGNDTPNAPLKTKTIKGPDATAALKAAEREEQERRRRERERAASCCGCGC